MPRSYRHISDYAKEILEMREEGKTKREICEILGFNLKQLTNFITRHNRRQDKISSGISLKTKGRPPKDYKVREENKIAELKYIIARKDARIKRLEMETNLMRDFLSLTERK